MELIEPNLESLAEARLEEAKTELEVAKRLLEMGLLRNAAGKTFQAWKSYLSYLAIKHRDLFSYKGQKRIDDRRAVPKTSWMLAVVPTSKMVEISAKLSERVKDTGELTAVALILHEYQYNGPDPSGVLSKIPNHETARALIQHLIKRLEEKFCS